jgi:hypothetical protein
MTESVCRESVMVRDCLEGWKKVGGQRAVSGSISLGLAGQPGSMKIERQL